MLGMFEDKDKIATMIVSNLDPEKIKKIDENGEVCINSGVQAAGQDAFNAFRTGDSEQFTKALVNIFSLLTKEAENKRPINENPEIFG